MPELPEVEVVRRSLERIFQQEPVVEKIIWHRPDLRFPLPLQIFKKWKKVRILSVKRRAKYLLIESDCGSLVCHLGMTGNFRISEMNSPRKPHDHVEFWLASGQVLLFADPRRFGFFLSWPGDWAQVTRELLGFEPLSEEWSGSLLKQGVKGRKAPIKTVLMDQKVVVGIGNIYASEILFRARVRPTRSAMRVSLRECEQIVEITREVLNAAIQQGGSSIRDFKSPGHGEGNFQTSHLVYDRDKKTCVVCATPIRRTVLSGRSTFWCPRCQT